MTSTINNDIKFIENRHENVYLVDVDDLSKKNMKYLTAMNDKVNDFTCKWYHSNASMDLIAKLTRKNLVNGLPKINFERNKICGACQFRIFL